MILPIAIMIAAYYFLVMLPQKKKRKAEQQMKDSLVVGDSITTIGGIIGTVVHIDGDSVIFETGEDKARMCIAKWGIGRVGETAAEPVNAD